MELRVYIERDLAGSGEGEEHVTVRSESDIRTAGFAAARAVREWLRNIPFVPSHDDLQFHVSAEVVPDEKHEPAPLPKRGKPGSIENTDRFKKMAELVHQVHTNARKRKSKRGK